MSDLDHARSLLEMAKGDLNALRGMTSPALALARFTVELQTRRDVLSFSRGERGEPRLRGRAGTAGLGEFAGQG